MSPPIASGVNPTAAMSRPAWGGGSGHGTRRVQRPEHRAGRPGVSREREVEGTGERHGVESGLQGGGLVELERGLGEGLAGGRWQRARVG